MSAEELKQLYLSQKDEINDNYQLYTRQFQDLITLGGNLLPVLTEYESMINKSDITFKNSILGRISGEIGLLTGYLSQMLKVKGSLDQTYAKSENSISKAMASENLGDVITAQNDYGSFNMKYETAPKQILDYSNLLKSSRSTIDGIGKKVHNMLPMDLSGKVFKDEDKPEENIKLLMADPVVMLFILAVIGSAAYYFVMVKYPPPGMPMGMQMPGMQMPGMQMPGMPMGMQMPGMPMGMQMPGMQMPGMRPPGF
jgi:hypothetical protein